MGALRVRLRGFVRLRLLNRTEVLFHWCRCRPWTRVVRLRGFVRLRVMNRTEVLLHWCLCRPWTRVAQDFSPVLQFYLIREQRVADDARGDRDGADEKGDPVRIERRHAE